MKLTEKDIWKKDFVTRIYKKEQGDKLNAPSRMSITDLANACTYCSSWENPYAVEIMKRSGHISQYDNTRSKKDRRIIFDRSLRHYGIQMF